MAAFLEDDWGQEDRGEQQRPVVFTGGDAPVLFAAVCQGQQQQQQQDQQEKARFLLRDDLAFRGLHSLAWSHGWLPPGVPPTLPPVAVLARVEGRDGGRLAAPSHLDGAPCEHHNR